MRRRINHLLSTFCFIATSNLCLGLGECLANEEKRFEKKIEENLFMKLGSVSSYLNFVRSEVLVGIFTPEPLCIRVLIPPTDNGRIEKEEDEDEHHDHHDEEEKEEKKEAGEEELLIEEEEKKKKKKNNKLYKKLQNKANRTSNQLIS